MKTKTFKEFTKEQQKLYILLADNLEKWGKGKPAIDKVSADILEVLITLTLAMKAFSLMTKPGGSKDVQPVPDKN